MLTDIIRFNQIILNTYEKFQYNYFHIQSLINIGKSIEGENKRDSKILECMINSLKKDIIIQKEAIKALKEDFQIDLNGEEEKLYLRNRQLGDGGFKLISNIKFKRLKEIDVSGNYISNIKASL